MSHSEIVNRVQETYESAPHTRASFADDPQRAMRYYKDYVDFVSSAHMALAGSQGRELLDVGCGNAWSSYAFANAGFSTTGVDLNPAAFECPPHANLQLATGSMMALPFPDDSFDIVSTYQCLEHIPDPRAGLQELSRVCRHGGAICVVGPNLLTPLIGVRAFLGARRDHALKLHRTPATPSHPGGNTIFEHVAAIVTSSLLLMAEPLHKSSSFRMRIPDTQPPFYGDNDACYLCNPSDIVKFFRPPAYQLLHNGKIGRLPATRMLAAGTWVSVQKL